jgi:hypothetical protein
MRYAVGLSLVMLTAAACGGGTPENPGDGVVRPGGGPSGTDPAAPPGPQTCVTTGPTTVNVTVTATQGPKGFAQPRPITNDLYSMGIDDQRRDDYYPSLDPKFVSYLKALRPGMLRFPAGHNGQMYQWQSSGEGRFIMTPALIDAFMGLTQAVGAQPYLAVNIETAPPEQAAAMIKYVNVDKKYGVKWWQIGNEPDLASEWPNESPAVYSDKFHRYVGALKSIDPNIKTVGGVLLTGENVLGRRTGHQNWFAPIVDNVGTSLDAFAWHYYPLYSSPNNPNSASSSVPSVEHLLQEASPDWPPASLGFADQILPYMRTKLASGSPGAQVWIDEFAEDPGYLAGQGYSDRFVGALWAADAMGRYANQGTDAIFHFIFKAGAEHYYTLLDANNDPRPEYYTFWLMANHFGDHLVNTSSDKIAQVASHAALRASDKTLRVMLVNKSTTKQSVRLKVAGFTPKAASQYQLTGSSYTGTDVSLNGQKLTPANIDQGAQAIPPQRAEGCVDNIVQVPALTVMMLVLQG